MISNNSVSSYHSPLSSDDDDWHQEAIPVTIAEIHLLAGRDAELRKLEQDLTQLHEVTEALAGMVKDDSCRIDSIANRVGKGETEVVKSTAEIKKAAIYSRHTLLMSAFVGILVGGVVAGPVGIFFGGKAAIATFCATTTITTIAF